MINFFYSKSVQIQKRITILQVNQKLLIKGPLGNSFLILPTNIFFENGLQNYRLFGALKEKNLILTYYKLLINKLKGVYLGFFEILTINGVGWRIALKDRVLSFSLGFSHPINYFLTKNIEIIIYTKQSFKVFGLDLSEVQQVVADLCKLRSFNVYKGKGIFKQNQIYELKESSKSRA